MKDLREIKLTRPRLIKIRDNFRKLLKTAVEEKIGALLDKQSEYETKSEEWSKFRKEITQLASSLNPSIVQCGMCNQVPGDRIYIAFYDNWFCLNAIGNALNPCSDGSYGNRGEFAIKTREVFLIIRDA